MKYSDKCELVAMAKKACKQTFRDMGIDDEFISIINPDAKTGEELSPKDLCVIMYIEGYLQYKKHMDKAFENLINGGK